MLTLGDFSHRFGRRDFLRIGALGIAGLPAALQPALLQAAIRRGPLGDIVRDRSIVFLHMQGGPTQFETFDPKMSAPSEIRCVTDEISTRIPGVTFGATFEKLAARADRLTVVRSFVPGDSSHDIKPIVSAATKKTSLGAIYARVAGTTDPRSGLPNSVWANPRSVEGKAASAEVKFGSFNDPGALGAGYAPFVPGSGGPLQQAMRLNLPLDRLNDRRSLLASLDVVKRSIDAGGALAGMDAFQEQAFQVILNGAGDAFDLAKEDPRNVARYDTEPLVPASTIDPKWNNFKRYVDHGRSLGKLMLLTRRLVEAGVGFITVSTDFVWDAHADNNNCGVAENMRYAGLPFDHAVSTFLDDLEARGLSDRVLLVCCGEIGRTPRINKRGGRDHWGGLGPLIMAGGGLPRGRVYGQSTRDGGEPNGDPVTQENLIGTLMNTAFDVGRLRLVPGMPTDILRIAEYQPIAGLV
ncbi:MAG: DUF1501 domain-containing protein [Planctomycetales bacterium]|nr:DUF1501 domain-containing protein [Planctomycetales bacterium]MBN8626783.1 DUF1501 domain-containing protein [Planctomycetota bacterium]